jgi:hypothetical protein
MSKGYPASVFSSSQPIDIVQSLDPFIIIYDAQGRPAAATGLLHNQIPSVPAGVLQSALNRQEDRVTWQPEPGLRIALVVRPFVNAKTGQPGGFVAVGRSLWETELKEDFLAQNMALIWLFSLLLYLIYLFAPKYDRSKSARPENKK